MKKYGIIAAMKEEMQEIEKIMTEIEIKKIYELNFIEGKINNTEIVLVEAGIGKVNAARTTQILIDNFDIDAVINVGSAGSANDELDIGDIVIADKLIQHDFDITAFGHPKGYISNVGQFVECDIRLIENMRTTISTINDNEFKIKIGTIASGDIFVAEDSVRNRISEQFNAAAAEMEGAAIGHVCTMNNIPFAVLRAMSDCANDDSHVDFPTFAAEAAKKSIEIITLFLAEVIK